MYAAMNQHSKELENTLQKADIHDRWEDAYRTSENARYYDLAFRFIAVNLKGAPNLSLLDAGCGICDYSLRLAKHDFAITAVDFSASVLENARANVRAAGFEHKIQLQRENLLSLSFADGSFDRILCWGVLMHIPEVEQAMTELARVLKPGGTLVISESNVASFESRLLFRVKRLFGIQKETLVETAAGTEHWATGSFGKLVTRQTNTTWLIKRFNDMGLPVQEHVAGQFTELYNRFSPGSFISKAIHGFNRFWFEHVRLPGPAFGNIMFFKKRET
jgi:ubiquinone/menaquinone biosynthesis C-methylase UbiE